MPNRTHIKELNKSWVCEHLYNVTDIETQDAAWVLVQEPGFIGFGVVQSKNIWLPPYKQSEWEPDWQLTSELRLFGEKGEWHVWRDWDGEHYGRLLTSDDMKKKDTITEHHFLWGRGIKLIGDGPWIMVTEKRGTEIWLPLESEKLQDVDLPLRLRLKQIIDYDTNSHLAGITDAALVGLTRACKKMIYPTAIS